jgi:hypothetical protein
MAMTIVAIATVVYVAARARQAWRDSSGYESPWRIPSAWWAMPYLPVRIYMRVADSLLFRIWWWTRPAEWWFAERLLEARDTARRRSLNRELLRRDRLGIAPDGGRFEPT